MNPDFRQYSDNELFLQLGKSGKKREAAFAEIFDRYGQRVYQYCAQIVNNRDVARDFVQETFLRLLNSAESDRVMTNLPGYLLRIARNLCLNAMQAMSSKTLPLEGLEVVAIDDTVESEELARLVLMALNLLPEDYREAVQLQMYAELSYKEIADVLGVPLSTVRNRIVRGRKKIREILAPYFEEAPG